MITPDTCVEDLIQKHPDAIGFLIRSGLPCVVCGEPFWGTLLELGRQKGLTKDQVTALVNEFNRLHE